MRYIITCDYCSGENYFREAEQRPENCAYCQSALVHLNPQPAADEGKKLEPDGITLVYQKTNEKIELEHSEIIVLGRQNCGKDILGAIPQVSREHCKIEYIDGQYAVTDLNSLNGTFFGSHRRDCRKHQQVRLTDGGTLLLGREPFMVRIRYKETEIQPGNGSMDHAAPDEQKFKCKACGKIHRMNLLICDECGSYGQLEELSAKNISS